MQKIGQSTFIDTTNNNLQLGTPTLGAVAAPSYGFGTVTGSPIAGGALPIAMVTGDFNGDGIPDLAVANYAANTVTVYLGNGVGGFAIHGSPISVGHGPSAIAVADFNRDGFADLAVANATDGTISVLTNDGSGTFSLVTTLNSMGNAPVSLAAIDFNADGNPDIVVVNQLSSTYMVWMGDGTAHFTPNSTGVVAAGGNASSVVVADFNGDGIADIAIANTYDGTVSVLAGNGLGAFSNIRGSPFKVTSTPSALAVGDFDSDGRPDLAVVDANNNEVFFLLNKSTGFVSAGSPATTGASPASVIVGDFNNDGKQDVAIANANDSSVTLLQGNGSGSFTAFSQPSLGAFDAAESIIALDINGDGMLDLAVANGGAASVSLREMIVAQTGTASLASLTVYGGGTHQVEASYAGDTNYTASISAKLALTGSLIPTTSTLFISPSSSVAYGTTVQLTDTISPSTLVNYSATGTVTFKDGANTLNTATVSNGQGVNSAGTLAPGQHTITATYAGDTNFAASSSSTSTPNLTVTQAASTTSLSASSNSITSGQNVTLSAVVVSTTTGTPTGSVNFYDGASLLSSAPLTNGKAVYSVTTLAPGATHTITATYLGDTNFTGSTAPGSVSITVAPLDLTFAVTGSPTQTVVPGNAISYSFQIAPLYSNYAGPVNFTVTGLPPGATATFSPTSVAANGGSQTVILTIKTAPTLAQLQEHEKLLGVSLALLMLPIFGMRTRRKTMMRLLTLMLIVFGSAATMALTGCGSGANGYFGQPQKSYTITVIATSGTLVHSSTITLTVE